MATTAEASYNHNQTTLSLSGDGGERGRGQVDRDICVTGDHHRANADPGVRGTSGIAVTGGAVNRGRWKCQRRQRRASGATRDLREISVTPVLTHTPDRKEEDNTIEPPAI